MRDTDRLIDGSGPPPVSLSRSLTNTLLTMSPRGPAPSSFVQYDASLWLPTIKAAISGMSTFVLLPWLGLTAFTSLLTLVVDLHSTTPWWASVPPFAHTVLGGALSFLLVFRTNTAYSRWWEARLMWGQITIVCRNIGVQSASMMTEAARLEVVSVLLAFPVALKNALRDEPTKGAELATAETVASRAQESRAPASRAAGTSLRAQCAAQSAPLVLLESLARAVRAGVRNDDGLHASAYLHLCEEVRSLTQAATACERIKTSPMPLGYVSALRAFLLLWLCTLPLTMLAPYGHAAVPAVSCIAFLFLNLESVALEIEQPFGHDANDLPLEQARRRARRPARPSTTRAPSGTGACVASRTCARSVGHVAPAVCAVLCGHRACASQPAAPPRCARRRVPPGHCRRERGGDGLSGAAATRASRAAWARRPRLLAAPGLARQSWIPSAHVRTRGRAVHDCTHSPLCPRASVNTATAREEHAPTCAFPFMNVSMCRLAASDACAC